MSTEGNAGVLAALFDGVSLLQGQIAALAQSNSRIEETQRVILDRIDTIDAGQVAVADILPILETILGRVVDDRQRTDAGYESVVKVLAALADGHREAREEITTIVTVLEAIDTSAGADRAAIDAAIGPLASGVEKLLELTIANTQADSDEPPRLDPALAQILANQVEDRKMSRAGFKKVSSLAAFSYAAASGHRGSLPVDVEDDPLLEMYLLAQPADLLSSERAVVHWRNAATAAGTTELIAILKKQYQPSPTDTRETRVLRYRLAAITRATITGRGATPPTPPSTIIPADRSAAACVIRSQELAQLWRAGESTALYAEPELAGALDLFALAERQAGPTSEDRTSPELVALHRELATRVEAGNRPSLADVRPARASDRSIAAEVEQDR
ncbi:hypothetical protein GCM10008023_38870 [Sphingomonas glacialis]|uniref:DUF222 domain-containing protein n=1 Tax=Sphingomonas glacialis TaxID=658225 RepID=A0ABQ3LU90_9SPHN|nr:hypothetical protein [Sphingomonas glacialis]GHH25445.1 hypothetical protein GCM10008023_38870 [Sphingomonas glacialis]